jgi:hypothetical protein
VLGCICAYARTGACERGLQRKGTHTRSVWEQPAHQRKLRQAERQHLRSPTRTYASARLRLPVIALRIQRTNNRSQGTDDRSKGTGNRSKGNDDPSKGTDNCYNFN